MDSSIGRPQGSNNLVGSRQTGVVQSYSVSLSCVVSVMKRKEIGTRKKKVVSEESEKVGSKMDQKEE